MKKFLIIITLFNFFNTLFSRADILIIPLKGVIELGLSAFVSRQLKEAEKAGIRLVILEIDTPGGRVDAADIISNALMKYNGKTVSYILNQAWSAGAMIALATDRIIMAPGSSIGSAEPRMGMGETKADEKLVSALRSRFRAIAKEKGHATALAEAMVDKDIEVKLVKINDKKMILTSDEISSLRAKFGEDKIKLIKIISGRGKLLNLSSYEAVEFGLAEAICRDRSTVLAYLGEKEAKVKEANLTWSETLVRMITHPIVSSLLLGIGFWAIIIELRTPGFGIPGIIGLSCFSLFFWGHKLAGLAQWSDLLLLILGVILLFIELIALPGFGIVGGLGLIAIFSGLILMLISHPIPYGQFQKAITLMGSSFLIAIFLFLFSLKFLPRTKLWHKIILEYSQGTKFKSNLEEMQLLGKIGVALSDLRPVGKAKFNDRIFDVVSEGDYIEKGANIKVVNIVSNRIKVKRV